MYQWKTHTVLASIDQTMMSATGVRHYGGIRRLPYLGIIFGLGIPQNVIVARMASVESMQPLVFGVVLLFVVVSFVLVYYRLQNIGMNPWWCLLMIVPIANLCGRHTLPDLPGGIRGHEETRYGGQDSHVRYPRAVPACYCRCDSSVGASSLAVPHVSSSISIESKTDIDPCAGCWVIDP